jgi:hypothetical protein
VADDTPTEKIIERAYFHVGNGGLTLSIIEERSPKDGVATYRFKHEMSVFGANSESSFPLGSSDIVSWMNMALQRVSMKVAAAFHDRSFQPFDNPPDVTHMNGEEIAKLASLMRVVARFQRQAFEFPSPEALRKYLHDHPNADKSKHTVEKKDEPEKEGEPEKKKSWGERLKSLGDKAKKFVEAAPKAVRQFIEDESFRRKAMTDASEALAKAPEKIVRSVVDAAKEEVHEFREAGAGVGKILKGEKPSKEESTAMRKVALHMAIGVAAAALSSGGAPLVGGASLAKGIARKIALKAITHALEHVNTLHEVGEIGHGLMEVMDKLAAEEKKPADPMEAFGRLIAAAVAKELKNGADPDDLAEAIEEAAGEAKK